MRISCASFFTHCRYDCVALLSSAFIFCIFMLECIFMISSIVIFQVKTPYTISDASALSKSIKSDLLNSLSISMFAQPSPNSTLYKIFNANSLEFMLFSFVLHICWFFSRYSKIVLDSLYNSITSKSISIRICSFAHLCIFFFVC